MKRFFSLAALLVSFALAAPMALAQSFAWEYSPKTKQFSPFVVPVPAQTFTEVPIFGSIDYAPLIGVESRSGRIMIGGLLSKHGKLAKQADWLIGTTFRIVQGNTPAFGGIVLGVTLRL